MMISGTMLEQMDLMLCLLIRMESIYISKIYLERNNKIKSFQVAGFSMTEGNVMHVIYIYWDNPDQSTDLSSSVTTTSPKTTFAYLGAPFGNVVNFQTRSGLSTVPIT